MENDVVKVVGLNDLRRYFENFSDEMSAAARPEFSRVGRVTKHKVRRRIKSKSGNLERSIKTKIRGRKLSNLKQSVYSTSHYAKIHEEGGEIEAKRAFRNLPGGPYLAFNVKGNRDTLRSAFQNGAYTAKVKKAGSNAKYVVINNDKVSHILMKKVIIKPTLKIEETALGEVPTFVNRLGAALEAAMKK